MNETLRDQQGEMAKEMAQMQAQIDGFEEQQEKNRAEWMEALALQGDSQSQIAELREEVRQLKGDAQFAERKWTKTLALKQKELKTQEEQCK